jgi:hypothetical protein
MVGANIMGAGKNRRCRACWREAHCRNTQEKRAGKLGLQAATPGKIEKMDVQELPALISNLQERRHIQDLLTEKMRQEAEARRRRADLLRKRDEGRIERSQRQCDALQRLIDLAETRYQQWSDAHGRRF